MQARTCCISWEGFVRRSDTIRSPAVSVFARDDVLFGELHDIAAGIGRPVDGLGVTDHRIRTLLIHGDDFGDAAIVGYPLDCAVSAVAPIHVRRVDMEEDQIGETADLLAGGNDGRNISHTTAQGALLYEIAAVADDVDPIEARGIQRNGGRARLSGRKRHR